MLVTTPARLSRCSGTNVAGIGSEPRSHDRMRPFSLLRGLGLASERKSTLDTALGFQPAGMLERVPVGEILRMDVADREHSRVCRGK